MQASDESASLEHHCNGLLGEDPAQQLAGAQFISQWLKQADETAVARVIDAGLVPRLVHFLSCNEQPALQEEAAAVVGSIAVSGSAEQLRVAVDAGIVQALLGVLRSQNDDEKVVVQAAQALGSVLGAAKEYRAMAMKLGGMQVVMDLLEKQSAVHSIRAAAWAARNLFISESTVELRVPQPLLGRLAELAKSDDQDTMVHACWALANVSTSDEGHGMRAVLKTGIAPHLLELLSSTSVEVLTPALRTIGNIVLGFEGEVEQMLNLDVLTKVKPLLEHPDATIRREVCWMVSNIAGNGGPEAEAVLDAGFLPMLLHVYRTEEPPAKTDAIWAICNAATHVSGQHTQQLVQEGAVPILCEMLNREESIAVEFALEAIEKVLRVGRKTYNEPDVPNPFSAAVDECGGFAKITELTRHEENPVKNRASRILAKYHAS